MSLRLNDGIAATRQRSDKAGYMLQGINGTATLKRYGTELLELDKCDARQPQRTKIIFSADIKYTMSKLGIDQP